MAGIVKRLQHGHWERAPKIERGKRSFVITERAAHCVGVSSIAVGKIRDEKVKTANTVSCLLSTDSEKKGGRVV